MSKITQPRRAKPHAFEYLYRDAANWKTHGVVLLSGRCPPNLHADIVGALDSGMYFVAEQVKIPALQRRHNAEHGAATEDLDHGFHEFVALRPATAADIKQAECVLPADVISKLFGRARNRWNCSLSPYA